MTYDHEQLTRRGLYSTISFLFTPATFLTTVVTRQQVEVSSLLPARRYGGVAVQLPSFFFALFSFIPRLTEKFISFIKTTTLSTYVYV